MLRVRRLANKGADKARNILEGGGQIKRTPEIIEAEFANLLTVSMLVFFVVLTLPGMTDDEELSKFCGGADCFTRSVYWVFQFLCVVLSGLCFLMSVMLLISYRLMHILPEELVECDMFFTQYEEEMFTAYGLLLASMYFGMWSVGVYYYLRYEKWMMALICWVAAIATFWLLYWFPREHCKALAAISEHRNAEGEASNSTCTTTDNPLGGDEMIEDVLTSMNSQLFSKYVGAFQKEDIRPVQLASLTIDHLNGILNIPLGDALRMVEQFKKRRNRRNRLPTGSETSTTTTTDT